MENEWKNTLFNTTVAGGIFIGACVLLLMYIINLFKSEERKVQQKKNDKSTEQSDRKKEGTHGAKNKKKASETRWGARSDKQGFSHPWLLTSLKGHTGQVLDMDFSSNGKYLASCAEEDLDPGGDLRGDASSSSDGNKENSRPSSADPSPRTKGLSRRQRKNRRRDDASPSDSKKNKVKQKQRPELVTAAAKKPMVSVPLKQWGKLRLLERDLVTFLRSYLLSIEQMLSMGYPMESNLLPGRVIIFKSPFNVPGYTPSHYRLSKFDVNRSRFDVNAQEFVPSYCVQAKDKCDSGQGSSSSSDSGENLDDSESSSSSVEGVPVQKRATKLNVATDEQFVPERSVITPRFDGATGHTCVRCDAIFYVKNSKYVTNESCFYHWGKLQSVIAPGSGKHHRTYGFTNVYSCCHGDSNTKGCTMSKAHVWSGINVGFNGPFDSYMRTKPRKTPPYDGNYGVYALDCEMCYTANGLELTKITVVGADGRLVYDSFVKPENEIVDYNTRFSGITAKDLSKKGATKTLREVQNDLMGFINADTILIGHGLENDLRALRLIHCTVVDTAVCFPHYNGLPYRRSLKSLTSCFLKSDIQTAGASGHNSYEDARACMELMLWRVRKDFRGILEHVQ